MANFTINLIHLFSGDFFSFSACTHDGEWVENGYDLNMVSGLEMSDQIYVIFFPPSWIHEFKSQPLAFAKGIICWL